MQMNSIIGVVLIIFCAFISAFSQVLLKKSASVAHSSWYEEYINVRVIVAYGILFATIIINMYALRFITFKLSNIIGTLSYVFVVIMSKIFFDEKISLKRYIGVIVIIIGIIVFNL